MPDPSPSWDLHKTPKPNEWSFSVVIPTVEVQRRLADIEAFTVGSNFEDFPCIPEGILAEHAEFGLYTFTDAADDTLRTKRFYFGKNRTAAEASEPFESVWKRFGNHRHAPVLEALAFLDDDSFPLATNVVRNGQQGIATGPRNFVREIFIDEVNEGSRFLLDRLVSNTPFRIGRFPVPQPGSVTYDINGTRGAFTGCLHDDIEIPSTQTANATYLGGTVGTESSRLPGQFFPRTNFKRRRPYFITAEQEIRGGVWYMERMRVFPPRQPKITVQ